MGTCGKRGKTQEEQMGSDTRLIGALEERGTGGGAGLSEGLCFRAPMTKWWTEQGRGLSAHLCCSRTERSTVLHSRHTGLQLKGCREILLWIRNLGGLLTGLYMRRLGPCGYSWGGWRSYRHHRSSRDVPVVFQELLLHTRVLLKPEEMWALSSVHVERPGQC